MKTTLGACGLTLFILTAALSGAAVAQTVGNSSSTSGSSSATSSTSSGALSGSASGVINNNYNGGGGTSGVDYSGTYTVKDNPPVMPPSIFGGTNPCTVGVSGGVSVTGFGLGMGGTWSDKGCERRNGAVILFQANMPDVAVALLCEDSNMRSAFLAAGKPCPEDRAAAQPAPVAMSVAPSAAAPTPMAPTPMAPTPAAAAPAAAAPTAAAPAATMVAAPAASTPGGGYQGAAPDWCSLPSKTPSDQAAHNYYCH